MRRTAFLPAIGMLLIGSALGEIKVDSRAHIALQNRTARSEVIWCEVFYADDFPDSEDCANVLDGQWTNFPSCCNGAFNCLNGGVWDLMLCPAEFVYDFLAQRCVPYGGSGCPTGGPTPGDEVTTELPPISCGTIRTGKLPYGYDCTKYIQCTQGEPSLRDCPTGYVFYIPFSTCLPGEVTHCELYQIGRK